MLYTFNQIAYFMERRIWVHMINYQSLLIRGLFGNQGSPCSFISTLVIHFNKET